MTRIGPGIGQRPNDNTADEKSKTPDTGPPSPTGLRRRNAVRQPPRPKQNFSVDDLKQAAWTPPPTKESKSPSTFKSFKSFKNNVAAFGQNVKQSVSRLKQGVAAMDQPLKGDKKTQSAGAQMAAFKAEATKMSLMILTEKAADMSEIDTSRIANQLGTPEGKASATGNGDLRRLATALEASAKITDLSLVPDDMRVQVEALQQFYNRADVKAHLIQAGTQGWHDNPSMVQKFRVMDQMVEAKALLGDLSRKAVD